MATLNVIRRWALREQMSIREIARHTGLARNTVNKYLRSDESEPKYARHTSSSKLDPYAEKLAGWLVKPHLVFELLQRRAFFLKLAVQ